MKVLTQGVSVCAALLLSASLAQAKPNQCMVLKRKVSGLETRIEKLKSTFEDLNRSDDYSKYLNESLATIEVGLQQQQESCNELETAVRESQESKELAIDQELTSRGENWRALHQSTAARADQIGIRICSNTPECISSFDVFKYVHAGVRRVEQLLLSTDPTEQQELQDRIARIEYYANNFRNQHPDYSFELCSEQEACVQDPEILALAKDSVLAVRHIINGEYDRMRLKIETTLNRKVGRLQAQEKACTNKLAKLEEKRAAILASIEQGKEDRFENLLMRHQTKLERLEKKLAKKQKRLRGCRE